jgi:hypothetical protein
MMIEFLIFFLCQFLNCADVGLVQNILLATLIVPDFIDKEKCLVLGDYLLALVSKNISSEKHTWRFS